MVKISTWNVNSIRARLDLFLLWLKEEKPDAVCLQEIKCKNEAFPFESIEDLGYNIAINGQKTYNGVAILSKYPLTDVVTTFPNNPLEQEARYIEALLNFPSHVIRLASVYVPNGGSIDSDKYQNKLNFLDQLTIYYKALLQQEEELVVAGDFNIALTPLDIYNPLEESILFSAEQRGKLRNFIASGLVDSYRIHNPLNEAYTWWDYRANAFIRNNGARIDYIFCSLEAAQLSDDCFLSKKWRSEKATSDHIPLSAIFQEKII
jgi:exodeoxyribonuclease III